MAAVQLADEERRRLITRGNELIEDERRRLSLEIHDELNAALISVRLHANALAAGAADSGDQDARVAAERIAALTDDLYRRARAIVAQLRPEVIDTLGLSGAIEEIVRRFDEAHASCTFTFRVDDDLPHVSEQVAIAAYRMVQEALSNVAKHAEATRCTVSLSRTAWDAGRPAIRLIIADDGRGFVSANHGQGVGLVGMRERAASQSGRFALSTSPETGTQITIELPLDATPAT